jgi:hypothetical protein
MKLLRCSHAQAIPTRCVWTWLLPTAGNPFSDEKSARLVIKQAVKDNYALGSVVIKVEGHDRRTICAYVADMS